MASILQGTDSSIVVSLGSDVDLSAIDWYEVRIVQGGLLITKSIDDLYIDLDNENIYVLISREDSFKFSATVANLQVFYRFDGESKTRGTYPIPFRILPMISPASYYEKEDEEEDTPPIDDVPIDDSPDYSGNTGNDSNNMDNLSDIEPVYTPDGDNGGDGVDTEEIGDVENG